MGQSRSFKTDKSGSFAADLAEPCLGPRPSPNLPRFLPDTLTHPLYGFDGDFCRLEDHDQPTINSSPACSIRRHTLLSPLLPSSLVSHDLRLAVLPGGSHAHTPLPVPCRRLKLSVNSPTPQPAPA